MKVELTRIADQIGSLILQDPFLERVEPLYLCQAVTAYTQRGGKMLRPAVCQWTCGAVGGEPDQARYVAAATEIFHTWTLVHDDIIDEDDTRRGGPSAHRYLEGLAEDVFPGISPQRAARFGTNMAILTGDVQQAFANILVGRALQDGVAPVVVLNILQRMNGELNPGLIGGEARDVEFEDRPFESLSVAEMMQMYREKTGLLLRFAAEAGAQIGLGSSTTDSPLISALGTFAEKAGLAFQLHDDILGMYGDEEALGKPVGSDLRKGKRTLLFAAALERMSSTESTFLHACLGNGDLATDEASKAMKLIEGCGALEWTRQEAERLATEAGDCLQQVPASDYRSLLEQWVSYVCQRTY